MNVGILGLGLIGGSLARAYAMEGHTVYAVEKDESMLSFAMLAGAVHGRLDINSIPQCDLILLAIYPAGSAGWLDENAPLIRTDALVLDCCGIKREICARCFPLAEKYGFTFVGGQRGQEGVKLRQDKFPVLEKQLRPHLAVQPCHPGQVPVASGGKAFV